ncbi:MAG: O-antigen ligase family protein [Lachnospiraceae bacterium]|nr:O-antigen ligase family protein [Lachnospiraceae bacterium]
MHYRRKTLAQAIEYLVAAMTVILCIVVPLYAKEGYNQIGNAKFEAYKAVMMTGCTGLLIVIAAYIIWGVGEHKKMHMSATDLCVAAYLMLMEASVISGGFYKDALWGCYGWNMGLMSQLSFVLLYFFLSRFGRYHRMMLTVLCATAAIVYVIGILHRMLIDPIGFYDGLNYVQKAQFLSTLGQASWYGSFLAVTLPVGIGVFLYSHKGVWRVPSGILMMLGFCTLVTQNSDSAYFALAGALLIFFMLSAGERETMCRFTGALTLFFAAGKIMYFVMQINPNPELNPDFVTNIMWTSGVTWVLFAVCLAVTIMLYAMGDYSVLSNLRSGSSKKNTWAYPAALMRKMQKIVPMAVIVIIVGIVLMICMQTWGMLPAKLADRLSGISYFNWNDEWGNGRGKIWRFSAKIFSEGSLGHKLFGVGPDCFNSYVNAYYGEEEALLWGEKLLTNAHNEWLNILINAGILGGAAYIGIYVTAIRRFMQNHRQNILLAGMAAACMSYMCYNFFCYQQVLCTPFIFILMGMGEYIVRQTDKRRYKDGND